MKTREEWKQIQKSNYFVSNELKKKGVQGKLLSIMYKISPSTVCDIYKGRRWGHLKLTIN